MPKVSVVITFLNSERFLAEAIESVYLQDYPDWELLLIDDGSSDGSREIAASYAGPCVRVLEHAGRANLGISASRNLGVQHARGSLIALLDSDDVWEPGKLLRQVELLDAHPEAAMVYSSALEWHSWSGSETADFIIRNTDEDRLVLPPAILASYLRNESMAPCTCTSLIRRHLYLALAGFCEEFTGLYDDQVFFAKLLVEYPVFVMKDVTARYRQHEGSTCAIAWKDGIGPLVRRRFLNWLIQYLAVDNTEICSIAKEEIGRLPVSVAASGSISSGCYCVG